jgi:3-deoxy-D-manno-octulosonic-acid transferase
VFISKLWNNFVILKSWESSKYLKTRDSHFSRGDDKKFLSNELIHSYQSYFMRFLYTVILYLLIPFILLRLVWRGFRAPAYWQRIPERFGFLPTLPRGQYLWIHAVSVGEVHAAVPLIRALKNHYPDTDFLITTMTPTGSNQVIEIFKDSVQHCYLPYDLPDAITRFFAKVQPRLIILMETELWPNLLNTASKKGIAILLANARLSEKSAQGYQRVAPFTRQMLNNLTAIAAQTQEDANRFLRLGARQNAVFVTGSIKFDSDLPKNLKEYADDLRQQWGKQRPVWIAASTHEGEDEQIIRAFQKIKEVLSNCLLVLVPRHPERFNRVATLCEQQGFSIARRSKNQQCTENTEIYLGDTMGELLLLYAACDVAFVGGSLVPTGGHNLLEPAALGLPIVIGQYVFNFAEISRNLLNIQAATQISTTDELAEVLIFLLNNKAVCQKMGEKGQFFVEQNRGSLKKLLAIILNIGITR